MPLTQLGLNANLSWILRKSNTGFGETTEGPDSLNFNINGVDVSTWNQLFTGRYSIAASGTQNIDLTSFTNLLNESVTFAHVLCMEIRTVGGQITLSPGASNPFSWGFGTTGGSGSPVANWTINNGGVFLVCEPTSGGIVVNSSHKNILLTNNGGTTSTVTIVIAGSTT